MRMIEEWVRLGVAAQAAVNRLTGEVIPPLRVPFKTMKFSTTIEGETMSEDMSDQFEWYERKQIVEMRPWKAGDGLDGKEGDMIARGPLGTEWLVSATDFARDFHPSPRG